MESIPNLWPKDIIKPEEELTPHDILKQQAAELQEMSSGVVRGLVKTEAYNDQFMLTFRIFAPRLEYSYELFTVSHSFDYYSLRRYFEGREEIITDRESFYDWLKRVFSNEKTIKIINTLRRQAED